MKSHWVPFVEDLRGTPDRLVHVECYVEESGLSTLVGVLTERDTAERMREFRRWQQEQASKRTE
ncbi:MAG: hypothetical protein HOW97_20570 [Catenulispora sp.]|nr:hypothetical protein [Catenulispora sp.]